MQEHVLICTHFYVEKLDGGFWKPKCKKLGAITVLCNPIDPKCGCPHFYGRIRRVDPPVNATNLKRVIRALILIVLKKSVRELEAQV
jgi:hypothetical protein